MRLALAVLAALPYLGALANDFVWDDRLQILGNAQLAGLAPALGYFGRLEGLYYRPLVFVSFAVEHAVAGDSPGLFHLTNVALHAGNTLLLFSLARRTGVKAAAAFFAAAAFALHPLQSEAVAYVAGRTDLLMTFGALIASLAVVPSGERGSAGRGGMVAAAASALAVLSKESGYALALLLPWLAWRHRDSWRDRVAAAAPAVATIAGLALLRPGVMPEARAPDLAAAGRTALEYLRLFVWPSDLQVDRLVPVPGLAAALVAVLLAAAAGWGLTRRGPVGDWTGWTLAFYFPVSNLLALYPAIADRALFTPEHNLYAPLAGIAVLVGRAAARLAEGRVPARAAALVGALVLMAWGGRTWVRVGDWRDEVTLFAAAARRGSLSPRVWFNLGNDLLRLGARADAVAAYTRATQLAPADDQAWANLGVALQMQGDLDQALRAYERAESLRPSPRLYGNLASLYRARGDEASARRALEKASQLR